jgi:hypothetical protein
LTRHAIDHALESLTTSAKEKKFMTFTRSVVRTFFQSRHILLIGVVALVGSLRCYGEKAAGADAFVDSVGVNVHLHHFDTPYTNFAQVESALKALHLRHVRDGLVDTTWKDYYNRHNQLGRDGIKGLFITSANQSDNLLLDYPSRVKDSFEAYEAPNEYDQSGDSSWVSTLSNFLVRLNRTVKSDSRTSKFLVIGPSLARSDSFAKLRGDCTFDYSNLHDYFAGRNPGTSGWGSNGYGSIVWNLASVNTTCSGKPVITTETGYQTLASMPHSVPESVAAKYVPRVFLEQWLQGIRRTYLYELIDLPQSSTSADKGFGLLHSDFSRKPAFSALANLTSLLADPGAAFTPSDLAYQLSGDTSNVHHLLLQKRNGSFFLALWVEEPCYDVDGKQPITVRPRQITVQTSSATRAMLHVLDSNGNMTSRSLDNSSSHSFQVTDAVSIFELGSRPVAPVMNTPTIMNK